MTDQMINESSEHERQLFENAGQAASVFENYTSAQITPIFEAIGKACIEKAEFYAEWAVRDTGYGNYEDKVAKKMMAAQGQLESWNPADFIEPVIDRERKIISYPKPAGIVVTLVPCTNPMFGIIGIVMQMVATRNVSILCPHPAAKEVSLHAIDFIHEVGVAAGAPENFIQPLREISIPAVDSIMKHPDTDLIVAVGGPAMVHAAYTSGNPAYGVGAGNCPCYVHETADISVVAPTLTYGSSFDWSLPCTTESVVLCDRAIAEQMRAAMAAANGYFPTAEEEQRIRDMCWPEGVGNPEVIGKSPVWIAEQAGVSIPAETRTIVIEISSVGMHELVSKEKLWPVIGFKVVDGVDEAKADALTMLNMIGKGHSASVHSADPDVVVKYGSVMPVCRVSINGSNTEVATGLKSGLQSSIMAGTGFWGGSVCSDPHPNDYLQWTRMAFHDTAEVDLDDFAGAV